MLMFISSGFYRHNQTENIQSVRSGLVCSGFESFPGRIRTFYSVKRNPAPP
ncbi:hypothetical protein HanIR_Chr06g0285991 [Helianthus annuus]|nr:hypothetical protein HanIR_Chr06g0285991 [Helianthus annuus]